MRRLLKTSRLRRERLACLAVACAASFSLACTPGVSSEDVDTQSHAEDGGGDNDQHDEQQAAHDAIATEAAVRGRLFSIDLADREAVLELEDGEDVSVQPSLRRLRAELERLSELDEDVRAPRSNQNSEQSGADDVQPPPDPEDACPADADFIVKGTALPDFLFAVKPKTCVLGLQRVDILGATSSAPNSTLIGGAGDDWLVAATSTKDMTFVGNTGNDVVLGTIRGDAGSGDGGSDLIWLAAGHDTFDAGSGDDYISGGGGRDNIVGGSGADLVLPGPGDDTVRGGRGDDVIVEGLGEPYPRRSGDDVVYPGGGMDLVYTGHGNDRVVIGSLCSLERGEILAGGPGRDTLVVPTSLQDVKNAGVTVVGFEEVEVSTNMDHALAGGECWREADGSIVCDCCSEGWSGRNCQTCDVPALALGLEGEDRCIIVPVAEQLVATVASPNPRSAQQRAEAMLNVAREADLGLVVNVTEKTAVDIEIEPGVRRVFTRVEFELDHLVFGRTFGFGLPVPGPGQTGVFYVEGGVFGSTSYTFSESTVRVNEDARYLVMLERRSYGSVLPNVDAIYRLNRDGSMVSPTLPASQVDVENAIEAVR